MAYFVTELINKHYIKNDLNICLKGELTVHSCRSFAFSSHSELMFFDDIIIQPHCKMLFLLFVQSVNHYTSMLLSFLGVFEIQSVDWFGLVFVLPLLKNKNKNYFQCTCAFAVLIQLWAFHPRISRPHLVLSQCGFPIHSCTVTKDTRPPCSAVLLPGTVLNWLVQIWLYIFPVPIQPCLLYRVVFSEKDSVWPGLVGPECFPSLGGPEHTHTPLNPFPRCSRCSPPTPGVSRPLPSLGTPTRSLSTPEPASLFPSGLDLISNEVMAHESDS